MSDIFDRSGQLNIISTCCLLTRRSEWFFLPNADNPVNILLEGGGLKGTVILPLFPNTDISDEYFVSNIEKVDSVTLLRKDKLLTGVTWTLRFQHALTVWPCLNDLGWVYFLLSTSPTYSVSCRSEACTSTVCGACEKARAHSMLQMFGQPYNSNTLATIPPNPEAMMNRVSWDIC